MTTTSSPLSRGIGTLSGHISVEIGVAGRVGKMWVMAERDIYGGIEHLEDHWMNIEVEHKEWREGRVFIGVGWRVRVRRQGVECNECSSGVKGVVKIVGASKQG